MKIQKQKLKIIQEIYDHFKKKREWPTQRLLKSKLNKKLLEKLCYSNPPFLIKDSINSRSIYKLSPLSWNICIFEIDAESKNLLIKYLNFIKEKYQKNLDREKYDCNEIKLALNLSSEELEWLQIIIEKGNFGLCMLAKNGHWEVKFPYDIEKLVDVENPDKYLKNRIKEMRKVTPSWLLKIKQLFKLYSTEIIVGVIMLSLAEILGNLIWFIIRNYLIK